MSTYGLASVRTLFSVEDVQCCRGSLRGLHRVSRSASNPTRLAIAPFQVCRTNFCLLLLKYRSIIVVRSQLSHSLICSSCRATLNRTTEQYPTISTESHCSSSLCMDRSFHSLFDGHIGLINCEHRTNFSIKSHPYPLYSLVSILPRVYDRQKSPTIKKPINKHKQQIN